MRDLQLEGPDSRENEGQGQRQEAGAPSCRAVDRGDYKLAPNVNRTAPIAIRRMPGQFASSPKNPTPRRRGSRVPRTGRPESGPLSDPRQITARTMYKTPPRTSSAPSPIRNISRISFIAATHNRTGIQARAGGFVPT